MEETKTHRPQDETTALPADTQTPPPSQTPPMSQTPPTPPSLHRLTCLSCRRQLPPEAFYHRANGSIEPRCKECRRQQARLQRKLRPSAARHTKADTADDEADAAQRPGGTADAATRRTLLTAAIGRDERLRLIRQALDEVRRRFQRQRLRLAREAFYRETGWPACLLYGDNGEKETIYSHHENNEEPCQESRNGD